MMVEIGVHSVAACTVWIHFL